jgi:hypothetical protein
MWQRGRMRRVSPALLTLVLLAAACSSTTARPPSSGASVATGASTADSTGPDGTSLYEAPRTEALDCDPLDERACLLPWPNDAFTVPDPSTPTGRRLAIQPDATPKNAAGTPIDVTDQNRADGFSPGSIILAFVPGLDVAATGIAPSTDIGASTKPDAPVVLWNASLGHPVPYWGELDAQAPKGQQVLMIHPAISLEDGDRYVVALRNLKDASGALIPSTDAFQAALDGTPEPPERARDFAAILHDASDAGVSTDGLYLAWDFTVASAQSLSGRVRHMRDVAYKSLGGGAPTFTVTGHSDSGGLRTVDGTFEVPNFLSGDGSPGSTFVLGSDGLPTQQPKPYEAKFHCLLPATKPTNGPTIVYGHGLLGDRTEADALRFAPSAGIASVCATDEIGMNADDVANLAGILGDLSRFPEQADRMQQGMLNQQYLGRLLNSPKGFGSSPAFQAAEGTPLIAVGNTVFVGNSQGGILGGAVSAISTEWSRVVLGVPGVDYSLLLPRSVDWLEFQPLLDKTYTDPVDRVLALQLIQLLWDRGENDGYAQHLVANPYPEIDPAHFKTVLLVEAFGDHQVANVSTEVLARTIDARVHQPALRSGRSNDVAPMWGILTDDGAKGPGTAHLVIWDYGTPAPPAVNLPPTGDRYGADPHGAGSREPLVLQQALTFLTTGRLPDVCKGAPCVSAAG